MLFYLIIFHFCAKVIVGSHLALFHSTPKFLYQHPLFSWGFDAFDRDLLCINDDPKDAIVWNFEEKSIRKYDLISEFSSNPKNVSEYCSINVCLSQWKQDYNNWKITTAIDVPMGPVFDSRWENFFEHNRKLPKALQFYYRQIKKEVIYELKSTTALVFSVRGLGFTDIRICEQSDNPRKNCYSVEIGYNNASITKCEYLRTILTMTTSCIYAEGDMQHGQHDKNLRQWETFVLTWDEINRTIKLYDPDKLILSYTDRSYISFGESTYIYYIYGSDYNNNILYRFHNYSYVLATKPHVTLTSPELVSEYSHNAGVCINMLVGLCKKCKLIVNLIDKFGNQLVTKTIERSKVYANVEHNLPMWQYENITSLDNHSKIFTPPFKLHFLTELSNHSSEVVNYHWAITKFEACWPEETIKRLKLNDYSRYADRWSTITCQRLSYNKLNREIVSPEHVFTSIPLKDLEDCPKSQFGPKCASYCQNYTNYCESFTMCNSTACFCTQGRAGSNCRESIEAVTTPYISQIHDTTEQTVIRTYLPRPYLPLDLTSPSEEDLNVRRVFKDIEISSTGTYNPYGYLSISLGVGLGMAIRYYIIKRRQRSSNDNGVAGV